MAAVSLTGGSPVFVVTSAHPVNPGIYKITTDLSSQKIKEIIDDFSTNGGKLKFGPGTFILDSKIQISKSNSVIAGMGKEITKLVFKTESSGKHYPGIQVGGNIRTVEATIKDLSIEKECVKRPKVDKQSEEDWKNDSDYSLIYVSGRQYCRIRDVNFSSGRSVYDNYDESKMPDGIFVGHPALPDRVPPLNVLIERCRFSFCQRAIYLYRAQGVYINHCLIAGVYAGVHAYRDCGTVHIKDSEFYGINNPAKKRWAHHAIRVIGKKGIKKWDSMVFVIRDNVFEDFKNKSIILIRGTVGGNAHEFRISGNWFQNELGRDKNVRVHKENVSVIRIENVAHPFFMGNDLRGASPHALLLENCAGGAISNNVIFSQRTSVVVRNGRTLAITANHIHSSKAKVAINIDKNSSKNLVWGNFTENTIINDGTKPVSPGITAVNVGTEVASAGTETSNGGGYTGDHPREN